MLRLAFAEGNEGLPVSLEDGDGALEPAADACAVVGIVGGIHGVSLLRNHPKLLP